MANKLSIRWRARYSSRSWSRDEDRLVRNRITTVSPVVASGSCYGASASNALSAISVSAAIVDSRWPASTRSCALPRRPENSERLARRVEQGADLGAQSAARAPNRPVLTIFLGCRRLALSGFAASLPQSSRELGGRTALVGH